ncbi:MAG: Na+/H+ antiporter NhaA [Acidimicrobiia bacterium]
MGLAGGGGLCAVVTLRRLRVRYLPAYIVIGAAVWFAMHESGVHATIAGVGLGLLTPARPRPPAQTSVAERLENALHPMLGLVLGKSLGITAASWLAVRVGLGRPPEGVSWRQLIAVAAVAGIGFTVSLFIAGLAFDDAELRDTAALATLVASVLAALLGAGLSTAAGAARRRG